MPGSLSPFPQSAIAARLRAAGCVFAEDEARLLMSAAQTAAELAAMVDRRAAGLPLEHVLGWAEFCGLRIAVDPRVFVPRRRTEFLVRQAAALIRQAAGPAGPVRQSAAPSRLAAGAGEDPARRGTVIVDLCCGSGALGIALAAALDRAELHAADIDPAAVRCARRNLAAAGGQVYEGDLYRPLPATLRGRVDFLVANVPYVPTGELGLLPVEARMHEPRVALDGGTGGLDVRRGVAAERGCAQLPICQSPVPAEAKSKCGPNPRASARSRTTTSASGERQILPRQTNSTRVASAMGGAPLGLRALQIGRGSGARQCGDIGDAPQPVPDHCRQRFGAVQPAFQPLPLLAARRRPVRGVARGRPIRENPIGMASVIHDGIHARIAGGEHLPGPGILDGRVVRPCLWNARGRPLLHNRLEPERWRGHRCRPPATRTLDAV